ncbi:MAG: hypothetical protein AABW80_02925 [Nanoarchaeota archaeon]
MKKSREFFIVVACFLMFSILFNIPLSTGSGEERDDFSINSVLIKASIVEGKEMNKTLSIGRGIGQQVNLEVEGIKGVRLGEESFVLNNEETKNINVIFSSEGLKPGVYTGRIKISDDKSFSYVSLVLEIESMDVFYDANLDIPPKYSTIDVGGQLVAQVKVFDLTWGGITQGLGVNSVDIDYEVYDLKGNAVSSQSENLAVDRQTSINKNIDFPKNVERGDYVLAVIVKYKSSISVSSQLFKINGEDKGLDIFEGGFDIKFILLLVVALIFFLVIIGVFVYLIRGRDKMIMAIRKYNDYDFRRRKDFIYEQRKALLKKENIKKPGIEAEVKKKIARLKRKYAERKKDAESVAKKGDRKKMGRMLNEWKKKGYNTLGIEYKLKGLNNSEMKGILNSWKKKYGEDEGYKNRG